MPPTYRGKAVGSPSAGNPVIIPAAAAISEARGERRCPTRACGACSPTRHLPRTAGKRSPVPGHWRSTAAFADADGPLLYRTMFEEARLDRGSSKLADVRRPLLPRRRVARRRVPRRHRGLLLPARVRGHRAARGADRAPARRRGRLRAADRPHGEAQHHRRVPALGLPRPRLEPRRHLAIRAARAHRPGPDPRPARALPRSDARACRCRVPRQPR